MKTVVNNIFKRSVKSFLRFYKYAKTQKFTRTQKTFAESLVFFKAKTEKQNGILLVQMVKDYEYLVKFAAASKVIAENNNLSVNFYDVNWMRWIGWGGWQQRLYNYFNKTSLEKICLHFGNKIIFSCEEKFHDQQYIQQKLKIIKESTSTPEEVLHIKFENILVGDLIYDTYLRYHHQPTLEGLNKELNLIIEIALNVFYNFLHFLKTNNVKVLLNTYSSYIEHGITARICLEKYIDVYTVGSYSYIITKLTNEFPYHQINHTLFSPDKKLNEEKLALAKQRFTSRFEGKIDAATNYMRQSSYGSKTVDLKTKALFAEKHRNIIIYAHDFYDSPHVNRLLQFPDLYQYLKQTLEALTDLQTTNVFIKIHPNGIIGCKEKTIELVTNFNKKHFYILDESVSNLNIIELKPDLIATARGTVCAEMAYFEIPTVALFDNLFANFNFTHTCYDTTTYFAILKGELKPKNDFNKEAIYSFYYQAYLEKAIIEEETIFNTLSALKGNTFNDAYLHFLLAHKYLENRETLVYNYADAIAKLN